MTSRMVKLLVIITLIMATAASAEEWYEGGTLHKAAARDWHAASYGNRLATSADFIAAAKAAENLSELRERAMELER